MKGILGRKIGMTQVFTTDGKLIPVTVIEATPNVVLQKKTVETDGYNAIQVGFEDKREKLANKPEKGVVAKANTAPKRFIKEFRFDEMMSYEVGQTVSVDSFVAGEVVDVTGTSKGKGYQGVIKRHGQHIGPKGHGSGAHRIVGSMVQSLQTELLLVRIFQVRWVETQEQFRILKLLQLMQKRTYY